MSNSLPMHERRPLWVDNAIDISYGREHDALPSISLFGSLGAQLSYDFGTENSGHLADEMRARKQRQLRVLDVGTGTGMPVFHHLEQGDEAQGVTAYDYRVLNPIHPLKDKDHLYIVGNAERLFALAGLQDAYDIVMSNHTLHHFADPLGGFEQLANKVGAAGLLCVDNFEFSDTPTPGVTAGSVVESMRSAGFTPYRSAALTEADLLTSAMPTAIWLRTEVAAPVRFPVGYGQNATQPLYVPGAR